MGRFSLYKMNPGRHRDSTISLILAHAQALPPVAARALEAEDEARHFLQAVAPPLVHAATGEVCMHARTHARHWID